MQIEILPALLGSHLIGPRGIRTIVAAWLEQIDDGTRIAPPTTIFTVLVVTSDEEVFKMTLPEPNWKLQLRK